MLQSFLEKDYTKKKLPETPGDVEGAITFFEQLTGVPATAEHRGVTVFTDLEGDIVRRQAWFEQNGSTLSWDEQVGRIVSLAGC